MALAASIPENGTSGHFFRRFDRGLDRMRTFRARGRRKGMRKTSTARVLIVEDVEFEAKLLMRTLADAGYSNLVHRSDYDSAVAELELGLSVVVDAASMKHFAMHLLGEDDAEGAEALLL